MKRCQLTILPSIVLTLVGLLATSNLTQAESPGYQSPSFYGATQAGGGQYRPAPPFPASPLAGGPNAALGNSFMDASGKPIVLQTGFGQSSQSCPSGSYCPDGYGGDPMAFNGNSGYGTQDQCGPHYFDVAFETVFLQSDDLAGGGLAAFTSSGVGNAPGETNFPFLNPAGQGEDYEAGWKVALRYDIGALSVLEATYMGLYDFGYESSITSQAASAQDRQLFSIFSNYGFLVLPANNTISGITGLDAADEQRLTYQSDLQSTEFSYRRYWVGNSPRVSGTLLAGFRYVRMTEEFNFSSIYTTIDTPTGSISYTTENDLLGAQFGGDGSICLRQGLRLSTEGKAGIYNNRFKYDTGFVNTITPVNLTPPADGNQIAFVAEGDISFVADIMPSWSLRAGYEFFYLNSLVTLQSNIVTTIYDVDAPAQALNTQGHAFYHGFHGGLEYVW